jgi:hypothetical protein
MALPNVSTALSTWKQDITLIQITYIQEADLKKTTIKKETPFKAVVQPLSAFKLQKQPAELRGLESIMVHIEANSPIILKLNDRIKWGMKEFSIRAIKNYSNSFLQTNKDIFRSNNTYGYIRYEAHEINENNSINYQLND